MIYFFVPVAFLSSSLLSFEQLYVFVFNPRNSFLIVCIIHLSLVQLFIHFFFLVMACLILCGTKKFFKIFCNIFANIICFYMENEPVYIRIIKFRIFTIFWFYIIIPCLDIILINLNKQSYSLICELFSFLLLINFL